MKIWIVTSKFGQGHFSVAQALKEEFEEKGHEVMISDIVYLKYPNLAKIIYDTFNNIICRNGHIYNFVNSFGRKSKKVKSINKNIYKFYNEIKPDMIVTTWSACSSELNNIDTPVYTCITDVGVHSGWINDNIKGYFVASNETKQQLIDRGIPEEKVFLYGIPVKKCFYTIKKSKTSKRKVLIMGGGLGIISWLDKALEEILDKGDVEVTIITGNNKRLYGKLKKRYHNLNVVGYTNQIHKYMGEADLLLSKPGGVSLFESIFAETPFIAVNPEYAHEIANANFISNKHIGKVVRKGQAIHECVLELLDNESELKDLQNNMKKIKDTISISKMKMFNKEFKNAI